jgi:type IV secretion system protein VirB10
MNKIIRIVQAGLMTALLFPALLVGEDEFSLPAGTTLQVRLITTLSSKFTQSGDPWTGQVVEPVFAGGQEVLPPGCTLEGRVTYVKEPGRAKGVGEMRLVAETLTTPGEQGARYAIVAALKGEQGSEGVTLKNDEEGTLKGPGKSKKDAAKEAGEAAAGGAVVGGLAHGGTGALYGMGIGAVASVIHSLAKHHKDIVLSQGTELTFVISRDVTAKKVVRPEGTSANQ